MSSPTRVSCQQCGHIAIDVGDRRCAYCDGTLCQIDISGGRRSSRSDDHASRWNDTRRQQVIDAYASGHNIPEIAAAIQEAMGYRNLGSARAAIRQELKRMGVTLRKPRKCAEQGCGRDALTGKTLCCSHNPERFQERADHLARVRRPYRPGEEHWKAKLWDEEVREILTSDESSEELSQRFGVTANHIRTIRAGKSWKHLQEEAA